MIEEDAWECLAIEVGASLRAHHVILTLSWLTRLYSGLVGYHEHPLRRAGKQESFVFRENQVMDVVRQKLATIKRNYDYEVYKFKPRYFACYDSAQTHQIKYQMPALVKKVPVAALMAGGAWYAVYRDTMSAKAAEPAQKTAPPAPSLAGAAASPGVVAAKVTTGEQYVAQLVPMVADVPWSAPAYVDRPVVSDPHVYCMATENSCRCVTEQNTRTVLRDDVCRDIARWGEPYNPYKTPHSAQQAQQAPPADPAPQARSDTRVTRGRYLGCESPSGRRPRWQPRSAGAAQTSTYTRPTTLEM